MRTSEDPHRPTRLDVAALRAWLAEGDRPRLLDVREPAEFEAVHIRWDIERQVRLVAGALVLLGVLADAR